MSKSGSLKNAIRSDHLESPGPEPWSSSLFFGIIYGYQTRYQFEVENYVSVDRLRHETMVADQQLLVAVIIISFRTW
jgi:hypothetical protein